jgi:hypothetical protein
MEPPDDRIAGTWEAITEFVSAPAVAKWCRAHGTSRTVVVRNKRRFKTRILCAANSTVTVGIPRFTPFGTFSMISKTTVSGWTGIFIKLDFKQSGQTDCFRKIQRLFRSAEENPRIAGNNARSCDRTVKLERF